MVDVNLDNALQANVVGDQVIGWAATLFQVAMFVVMGIIIAAGVYYLMRFLSYSSDVELWERKGDKLEYFGDDKVRRIVKDGSAYMNFLKNGRDSRFKDHTYPDSKLLFRKKFFGTKFKALINNNEIIAFRLELTPETEKVITAGGMPANRIYDNLQRNKAIVNRYKNNDNRAQTIALVISVTLIGVLMFGLFVIWQSNVVNAEAMQALASSINADASARAQSFAEAIG